MKAQGLELGGYIGANNEDGGKLAGEEMIAALGGKGKIAILEGIRGVDNAEARKRGFLGAVTTNFDIVATETANWKTEEAYAKTQNILKTHPDLNGIFCANDNMAIGALKAVAEAGKKGQIKVIGYDNIRRCKARVGVRRHDRHYRAAPRPDGPLWAETGRRHPQRRRAEGRRPARASGSHQTALR